MRTETGKISDKKYNQMHPKFGLRLQKDILERIPGKKSPWIKDAIMQKLLGVSSQKSELRTKLLYFLIQTFIAAELEIEMPDDLQAELIAIIHEEMNIDG